MNLSQFTLAFAFASLALLSACGGSSSSNNNVDANGKPVPKNRVNWAGVSSEFNPQTEDYSFSTSNSLKLRVDAFGFNDDAEVVYTNDVPKDSGIVRLYKVSKNASYWSTLSTTQSDNAVNVRMSGTYSCSINIKNGQIQDLDGGCYVRLQVLLPVGSQLEVYNAGTLISNRFIPVDAQSLIESIRDASLSDQKFAAIEDFFNSYAHISRRPSLTADQLGQVIDKFAFAEEKFKALTRLQSIVTDRGNLNGMIENKFSYFDREQARHICGI